MKRTFLALCLSTWTLTAQSIPPNPGDPLPGISPAELEQFQSGRFEFAKDAPASGLNPDNIIKRATTQSCAGCHQQSSIGGSDFTFSANSGRNTSTPLYGAGLIEAIPDDTILALRNRPEALALGIGGRAAMVVDSVTGRLRVGRFGWNAGQATLLDASAANMAAWSGIPENTSRNETPDPNTGLRTIDRLAAFGRYLAPVSRITAGTSTAQGDSIFNAVGCAVCHTRTIFTAPVGSLGPQTINPFSDFLLHNIGTGSSSTEVRTAPLWGARLRKYLLHDGSAATFDDAIRAHRGEATTVRQRFDSLPAANRQAVIEFLKTL